MAVCSMEDGLGQCCSQDHIATHKKAWAHASQGSHVSGRMHLSVTHLSAHASRGAHASQCHTSQCSCISGLMHLRAHVHSQLRDPQGYHACAFCGTQRCVRPSHNFTVIAIRVRETMSGHHPKGDSESRSDSRWERAVDLQETAAFRARLHPSLYGYAS